MAEGLGLAVSTIAVIQLTGKLAALGYDYISGVKDASKDLRRLVTELHSLSQVLFTLQEFLRDNKNLQPTVLQMLDGQNGLLSECILELKRLQLRMEPKAGWRATMKASLMWPLNEKDTMRHISQLERYKSSLNLVLARGHLALSTAIDASVNNTSVAVHKLQAKSSAQIVLSEKIQGYVQDMNLTVKQIYTSSTAQVFRSQDENITKKRETVLRWLSSELGNFDNKHLEISRKRRPNTGKWLLQEPTFHNWIEGQPKFRLLWGYGIPGAGKTFLSSMVIDHLQEQAPKNRYGVAHIYFDYMDQGRQKPISILANLIKQLSSQIPHLPIELENLYNKLYIVNEKPQFQDLHNTLLATSKAFSRVFLIFDALDECNEDTQRSELLPLFHSLVRDSIGISVFLTSRPHPEDMQSSLKNTAKIELLAKTEDIEIYIQHTIDENPRSKRLIGQNSRCREKIVSDLAECAKGMFLLVRFHIEYLCKQTTLRQIMAELEKLKNSSTSVRPLDPTYDRVMKTVYSQTETCTELAFTILSWLVKAKRTLTFEELQQAISVEPNRYELDASDLLVDKTTLLDVCASLVTIDEDTNTVRLAHYTVQEYLHRNQIPSNADFRVAVACTTYLSFDAFSKQGACTSIASLDTRLASYLLLRYSAKYFGIHLNACDKTMTTDILLQFLNSPQTIDSYLQVKLFQLNSRRNSFNAYPRNQLPLHVASSVGHYPVVKLLLANGADVFACDSHGQTALHLAAHAGHNDTLELLLKSGADISAQEIDGATPLHIAAEGGHKNTIQLLLDNGADISAQRLSGASALHAAASGGHNDALELLLKNGVDISVQNMFGFTPLHLAASRGKNDTIKLLLKNGASISVQDHHERTPLLHAAEEGYSDTIRLLLKNGADISAQNDNGDTAVHLAAERGHSDVIQLLLENDVDISTESGTGGTALHLAVIGGYSDTIRLLLDNGLDTADEDNDGNTALHLAASGGFSDIIQILLENDADILAQNSYGKTALHFAVSLLDREVGNPVINILDKEAVREVVRVLLENGANPLDTNGDGESVLDLVQAYPPTHSSTTIAYMLEAAILRIASKTPIGMMNQTKSLAQTIDIAGGNKRLNPNDLEKEHNSKRVRSEGMDKSVNPEFDIEMYE